MEVTCWLCTLAPLSNGQEQSVFTEYEAVRILQMREILLPPLPGMEAWFLSCPAGTAVNTLPAVAASVK